jgi:single-stranded DNA-binding protein
MQDVNQFAGTGVVAEDSSVAVSKSGTTYLNFVLVMKGYKDAEIRVPVKAFGTVAQNLGDLSAGERLTLSGSLSMRTFTSRNDQQSSVLELVANAVIRAARTFDDF